MQLRQSTPATGTPREVPWRARSYAVLAVVKGPKPIRTHHRDFTAAVVYL